MQHQDPAVLPPISYQQLLQLIAQNDRLYTMLIGGHTAQVQLLNNRKILKCRDQKVTQFHNGPGNFKVTLAIHFAA